ncbi:MAG: DinB family protein [Anaerolineae bacterium]|nr:DinB family protein [Anaerolineae bacterium]
MNADAFRQLYDYHFSENRKLWDRYITALTDDQFTQKIEYSLGSVRNHVVHLMSVDDAWFSGLRGVELPEWLKADNFPDKPSIRAYWDGVEARMREYLATLTDAILFTKPFPDGEDENLILWQVLLHVANHGTDHRAQLLRMIHDLGVKTGPQDFIFYVYDHA